MTNDEWNEPRRTEGSSTKEWKLIEKLVTESGKEQRRARRWGITFKLMTFAYLFALLFLLSPRLFDQQDAGSSDGHTALVEVQGVIASGEAASADNIASGLRSAFESEGTTAVMLRINSPGGSPVQSGYVYDEIVRLRAKYPAIKLYAVISDLGASGAYYMAAAADEIYADKASLVGSIGVLSSSFGFVNTMEKLGVERRLQTAGDHKAFLDPFSPQNEGDRVFWQQVLDTTHQQFIDIVKKGRGDRLKETPEIFSGLIWTGEQALELGLIDGLGSAGYVAREVIGEENIVDFTPRRSPLEAFTERLGASMGKSISNQLGFGAPSLK